MSAETFLKRLQDEDLIDESVISKLRQQVDRASAPIPAQQVAGLLVEKGHLTKFQAKKLLEGLGGQTIAESGELDLVDDGEKSASKPGSAPPPPPEHRRKGKAAPPPAPQRKEKKEKAAAPPEPKKKSKPAPAPAPAKAAPAPARAKPADDQGLQPLGDDDLQPLDQGDLQPIAADDGLTPMGGDAFGSDPMMDAMPLDAATAQPQQAAAGKPNFRGKKFRANQWDSPWLLIGGGILILLMLLGGWLVFVLTKGDADEIFEAADKAYRQESYSDAIDKFDIFLEQFPEDDSAPKARVYRALAKLWLPLTSKDWKRALEVANEELPKVQAELADVPEARTQLSSQLTMIGQGIVADAVNVARTDTEAAKELLQLLDSETNKNDAMDLVANPTYVPSTEREKPVIKDRIDQINEDILRVRREINKEEELVATVARMTEAADAGKTSEAFEMRILLMQKYGEGVGADPRIVEAVKHVAEKERGLVQAKKQELAPSAGSTHKDVAARIVLASRVGSTADKAENRVAVVLVRGTVYALDAASGKILWRRYVGRETTIQPQRISEEDGADVVLVDGWDNSLLRLSAATGEIKWRLEIGNAFARPIITADRILVADQSGRTLEVDPGTGTSNRHVQFPQSLYAGPAVSASGSYIYQPGEHSNIYVIATEDMGCRDVLYLGHKPGSVPTAPAVSQGFLFVVENSGANYSILHILEVTERGLNLRKAQTIRLEGHVVVPLQLYGRRVVAVTDLGAIHVFEVLAEDDDAPVEDIARYAKRWSDPVVGYPLAASGYLWVADRAFSIFQLQTARGQVSPVKALNDQDTFLAPPQLFDDVVVHVRQRRDEVGATVTAVRGISGDTIWRTDVSVPLAGDPVFDKSKDALSLVTAQASLFEVKLPPGDGAAQPQVVADNDAVFQAGTSELRLDLRFGMTFPDGLRTFAGPVGSHRLLRYDPNDFDRKTLRFRAMAIPRNSLAAEPVVFGDGMLVPANDGRIYHLDPALGKEMSLPFQPALEPGKKLGWQRPKVLDSGSQFVALDDKNRLHLVEAVSDPKAHLTGKKSVEAPPSDELRPPTVAGSRCFVFARGKDDAIVSYQLPNLDGYQETIEDAKVTWGPYSIDNAVVYSTDDNKLHCVNADHTERWAVDFQHGFLVDRPLVDQSNILVATKNGTVVKLNAQSGAEAGKALVGEPLEKGPYLIEGRLMAVGPEGTIHVLQSIP